MKLLSKAAIKTVNSGGELNRNSMASNETALVENARSRMY